MRGKKVLLSVTGTVQDLGMEDFPDQIRLFTTGELSGSKEQNRWRLRYTETQPESTASDVVTFTMEDGTVTMQREGETNTSMIFRQGNRYEGSYATPYGELAMGVYPTHVRYNVEDARGEVVLKYQLDIQGQFSSVREMRIKFAPSRRA